MEKRANLALLICFLLLMFHFFFVLPRISKQKTGGKGDETRKEEVVDTADRPEEQTSQTPDKAQREAESDAKEKTTSVTADTSNSKDNTEPTQQQSVEAEEEETEPLRDDIMLENSRMKVTLTNQGAAVTSVELKDFYEDVSKSHPLRIVKSFSNGAYSLLMEDPKGRFKKLSKRRFKVIEEPTPISGGGEQATFQADFAACLQVTKKFVLPEDRYHIKLFVTTKNLSDSAMSQENESAVSYQILSSAGIVPEILPTLSEEDVEMVEEGGDSVSGEFEFHSSGGALLVDVTLSDGRGADRDQNDCELRVEFDGESLTLGDKGSDRTGIHAQVRTSSLAIKARKGKHTLQLRAKGGSAPRAHRVKVTEFRGSTPPRDLKIVVAQAQSEASDVPRVRKSQPWIRQGGFACIPGKSAPINFDEDFHEIIGKNLHIFWGGAVTKYFAAVLQPKSPESIYRATTELLPTTIAYRDVTVKGGPKSASGFAPPCSLDNAVVKLETEPIELGPAGSEDDEKTDEYLFFVGPKKDDIFAQKEYHHFGRLISYGWFDVVSKALLGILHAFHWVFRNYGISIILLTLLVKCALHPFSVKSRTSMHKMQKLQPKIKELQEKYKNDKQRLGREQMTLFKDHGVNPMSGCLPMFPQFIVFIALYRALQFSFDLRQTPFIFWIKDLSRPDTICHLPFSLPILGNQVNILPVVMSVVWFLQQKMMPKSPDPQQSQQQKIMAFMPIFFGFILYSMPSGLTLYWLTSSTFGIIEERLIRRKLAKLEKEPPVSKKKKKKKKKKSQRSRRKFW